MAEDDEEEESEEDAAADGHDAVLQTVLHCSDAAHYCSVMQRWDYLRSVNISRYRSHQQQYSETHPSVPGPRHTLPAKYEITSSG